MFLLLVPLSAFAKVQDGRYKKEKTIKKAYNVSGNILTDINNRYGMITVSTWDQNRTEIDVLVRVSGNNEREVTERFQNIDVNFTASNSKVAAKSSIGNYICNGGVIMEINFVVRIPRNGRINLENEYGNIRVGEIHGASSITIKYGQINVDALLNNSNIIDLEYSGGSRIGHVNAANINAKYSEISVGRGNKVSVQGEYSMIKIDRVEDLNYKLNYGELKSDTAGVVTGIGEYLTTKFENITKLLNITANYGHVNVGKLQNNVKNVAVVSQYTSVHLGYAENFAFDFEIILKHDKLDSTRGLKFTQKTENTDEAYYKGYNIKSGVNKLFIKSEFGHIKLQSK